MPLIPCPWDTGFFGYSIAAAVWASACPDYAEIATTISEARSRSVRLLYLILPPVTVDIHHQLVANGALAMGGRREYVKALSPAAAMTPDPDINLCCKFTDALGALALESGRYSRFRLDPNMGMNAYQRLYYEWLSIALRNEQGGQALIAGDPYSPRGLVTIEPLKVARIGLLAVAPAYRGQGLGRHLLTAAEQVCLSRNLFQLHVATQTANTTACHLYESAGFQVVEERDYFHIWF